MTINCCVFYCDINHCITSLVRYHLQLISSALNHLKQQFLMGFSICRPSCVSAATNEHAVANWSGKDHTQPYGCSAQLSHCQQWSNLFKNPSQTQHIWLTKNTHTYFLCVCSVSWALGSWRKFLNRQSSLIFPDWPFFSHCCSLEERGLFVFVLHSYTDAHFC